VCLLVSLSPPGIGDSLPALLTPFYIPYPSTAVLTLFPSSMTTLKRPHVITSSPPPQSTSDDEARLCPICYDPWTNSGPHRIVSAPCGHLFGLTCITNWLMQGTDRKKKRKGARCCPQCKAEVELAELRPSMYTVIYKNNSKWPLHPINLGGAHSVMI